MRRVRPRPCQLAEALVKGEKNSRLSSGPGQYIVISCPGAAGLTHTISYPADWRSLTAAPRKFSLARNRMSGCAWEYSLRTQYVPRVGQARDYVVPANPGIVGEDFGFAPSIGHEANHELYGEPGAADDRLA